MRHGLIAHGVKQRRGVLLIVGAGIDNRDLALADDVTHRAREGEGARVVAENPPYARADLVGYAGLKRKIAIERDIVVGGHGNSYLALAGRARQPRSSYPAKAGVSGNRRHSR